MSIWLNIIPLMALGMSGAAFSIDASSSYEDIFAESRRPGKVGAEALLMLGDKLQADQYSLSALGILDLALRKEKSSSAVIHKVVVKAQSIHNSYGNILPINPNLTKDQDLIKDPLFQLYTGFRNGLTSFYLGEFDAAKKILLQTRKEPAFSLRSHALLATIFHLDDRNKAALDLLKMVRDDPEDSLWQSDVAAVNTGRVLYAESRFDQAISEYAKVRRKSALWPRALFESSWAFFLLGKFNNALGNIHTLQSPFYRHVFLPESYALKTVSLVRLCRFPEAKRVQQEFLMRYEGMQRELKYYLSSLQRIPQDIVQPTGSGLLESLFRDFSIFHIVKSLRDIESELESMPSEDFYQDIGSYLKAFLQDLREELKSLFVQHAERILKEMKQRILQAQTQMKLIHAELLLGQVAELRNQYSAQTTGVVKNYIGDLSPLVVGQRLEYWPFEGEYWEDELGGYVYNFANKCRK